MRVVLQRVSSAAVTIAGRTAGRIDRGLLVLLGIEAADKAADGAWLADKLAKLRLFSDAEGKMNLALCDLAAASPSPLALVVSQFTLHASTAKGTRPSFNAAARPEHAKPLYEEFVQQLGRALGGPERVQTGEFGAMMAVALVNDGPVTLVIDSKARE